MNYILNLEDNSSYKIIYLMKFKDKGYYLSNYYIPALESLNLRDSISDNNS